MAAADEAAETKDGANYSACLEPPETSNKRLRICVQPDGAQEILCVCWSMKAAWEDCLVFARRGNAKCQQMAAKSDENPAQTADAFSHP